MEDTQSPPVSRSFLYDKHEDEQDQRVTYLFPRRSVDTPEPGQVPYQEGENFAGGKLRKEAY